MTGAGANTFTRKDRFIIACARNTDSIFGGIGLRSPRTV
jgi:hypothetical protein